MRWFAVALLLLTGCFPVRPGTPTSGIGAVPRPTSVRAEAPSIIQAVAIQPTDNPPNTPAQMHQAAVEEFAKVHSYVARLRRRESRDGKPKPEELILFKERKEPFSVHFKWIGPEAKDREVLYSRGRHGDKLHIITAAGDVPFTPGGRRMALARDSVLVKAANPHHDITDAGLSYNIKDISDLIAAAGNSGTGVTVRALPATRRSEYPQPVPGIEIVLPPGRDPEFPNGGKRQIYYCQQCRLPLLYLSFDENGQERNYNCYDRLQFVRLDDDDFHPDKLWGKPVEPKK